MQLNTNLCLNVCLNDRRFYFILFGVINMKIIGHLSEKDVKKLKNMTKEKNAKRKKEKVNWCEIMGDEPSNVEKSTWGD